MISLENTLDTAIHILKNNNITDYEISLDHGFGTSTAVRLGNVETLQNHSSQDFAITIFNDKQKGHASSADLSADSLQKTINAASLIAKYTSKDPFVSFADKDLMAWDNIDLDCYYPWQLSAQQSIDITLECEQVALDNKKITNSEGSEIATFEGISYYANSLGLVVSKKFSSHSLHCGVIASDKDDMQNAYDYSVALDKNDLTNAKLIGQKAAEKAIDKLHAKVLKSQKCPIVLDAEISSSLFGNFFVAISGSSQYNKTTFLLDSVDKSIFPKWLNIQESPLVQKTIGASSFDNDGVKTREQHFILDGILQQYLLSQYSANQLGLNTTANSGGINNCLITSNITKKEILKKMGTGVLVTELMGQGVDITTGNYSRGASGFWVENGIIQYPVSGITIAGNLQDMFKNIIAIADDVDNRKTVKVGSVLIDNMAIAGE